MKWSRRVEVCTCADLKFDVRILNTIHRREAGEEEQAPSHSGSSCTEHTQQLHKDKYINEFDIFSVSPQCCC